MLSPPASSFHFIASSPAHVGGEQRPQRRSKSPVTSCAKLGPPRFRFHYRLAHSKGSAVACRAVAIERNLGCQLNKHFAKVGMAATDAQIHGAKKQVRRTINRTPIDDAAPLFMTQINIAGLLHRLSDHSDVTRGASPGTTPTIRTRQQHNGKPDGLHCCSTSSPEQPPSHARASTASGLVQVQQGSCMRLIGILNASCE